MNILNFFRELYTAVEVKTMATASFIGAVFSIVVGGVNDSIKALVLLVIIDYITGLYAGFKTGTLSSNKGFRGAIKKIVIFGVVGFANLLDSGMGISVLKSMAIFAYSANEGLSIIENIDRMGHSEFIPSFLRNKIETLRKERGVV